MLLKDMWLDARKAEKETCLVPNASSCHKNGDKVKVKKLIEVALGVMTSIGGFLDAGALATAAGAGAAFGFSLLWVVLLGTICVIFLVEMSGRLAAVSHHTIVDAVRERFGFKFFVIPLAAEVLVDWLVLAAELGGVCIALEILTGINFRWFAVPVAFLVWLLVWRGNFQLIERGTAFLGMITLVFVVAAFKLHPPTMDLLNGFVPSVPSKDLPHYCYIAVAILGALLSPYLFYFYSSGAIEDRWTTKDLGVNRIVAGIGMGFGSLVAMGVLIVAAVVLHPAGVEVEKYQDAARMLVPVFGEWGVTLFAVALGIACFGAALEVDLDTGYILAQTFGWEWGENKKPADDARFSTAYTVFIAMSTLLLLIGLDPLQLTMFSMALTAVVLPVVVLPFLVLMNDKHYLGNHRNGWLSNAVVLLTVGIAFVLAIVAIPLEIVGG